jgi:hypothetical protein
MHRGHTRRGWRSSVLSSRGGSIGSCILYATGRKVRKIGEPRAGFDLRKRTIEDAFSEGFPIRAMVNDAPMDHTGRAVLLQWRACHSMSARGLAHGKHLNHITSCRYSLSLGLFVSSYPLPFDAFLSIRGDFYQRPSWGAVLRPVRCPSSISPSEMVLAIAVGYARLGS